jgi:nucleoside-diphosphate-sugar epimerase
MARQTVLLTGVSGFIGFRVLLETLERDYDVRAVVRSEEKANIVQSNPAFQKLVRESQISFVTIADFLAPGAFDQALQGVDFVIHVASPNVGQQPADGDFEKFYVDAAVRNTLMVLDGAKRIDTIKKVVITSSAGAFLSGDIGPYTAESRLPDPAYVCLVKKVTSIWHPNVEIEDRTQTACPLTSHPRLLP